MSFLLGALIGASGGYVAALLLAPQKGADTQQAIKKQKDEVKLQAMEQLEKTMAETEDWVDNFQKSIKSNPHQEIQKDNKLKKEHVLVKKDK